VLKLADRVARHAVGEGVGPLVDRKRAAVQPVCAAAALDRGSAFVGCVGPVEGEVVDEELVFVFVIPDIFGLAAAVAVAGLVALKCAS
jgi:hypothetical protein